MTIYFVTSTGTEIGKTYLTCRLIAGFRACGMSVDAVKPIISGFDPAGAADCDAGLIIRALGREITTEAIDHVSPWRFAAPLSPDMAAEREARRIALEPVAEFCRNGAGDCRIVEGAGGVMSPLGYNFTNLDLITALDARVLLVAGTYLGTISHTLTACSALDARGRVPWAVILSDSGANPVAPDETAHTIQRFAEVQVHVMGRNAEAPAALIEAMTT